MIQLNCFIISLTMHIRSLPSLSLAVHTSRLRDSFRFTISNRLNVNFFCVTPSGLAFGGCLLLCGWFYNIVIPFHLGLPCALPLNANFWVSFISYILDILPKYMNRVSLMMSSVVLWYPRVSLWLLGFWFWIVRECYRVGSLFLFWCPSTYCQVVYRA